MRMTFLSIRNIGLALLLGLCCLAQPRGAASAGGFEIVVVGGTPGGIAAAITAARLGHTVALVEYNNHIGGMTTSGLGKSDIENRAMIGGLFKEFVQRVHAHYVKTYGADSENVKLCHDGYYFEPSVAEAVFEAMLREHQNLSVMKGWRLQSARVKNNRLTAIEVARRSDGRAQTLTGRVFIDATYEGDLYAAAGAEFRLGRESREEFGEPHAGVAYFDYQNRAFLPGTTGAADDRLPAYTYRLCLTTDPVNAQRLTAPPPDYDRQNYLGYFDDLKAGRLAGPKEFKPGRGYNPAHFNTLVRALSVTGIPNRKTDVNINPRPLGFPFPEENRGYVEGDDATRQRIRERHRRLTLGLLWFLQTDPDVPATHRQIANQYHLPKDEFTDNEHFPFQLYVREARRLLGEYTLTEHDITGDGKDLSPRRHVDSIAVGEFPIDSFPVRKRQPGDTIVLEGYLGMLDYITRPYEIPYRIMIPKKVDGLLAPVAASTTHIAFSSIRMEPTWMALGQAAGNAAHLAIKHDRAPRSVTIKELQELLLAQGQVIRHAAQGDAKQTSASLPPMLKLPVTGEDPTKIDFTKLPVLKGEHALVTRGEPPWVYRLHNYLAFHEGKYWCLWSHGPVVEDNPTQNVRYATSADGLKWTEPREVMPSSSRAGFRYIARGLWVRDGKLLALASHDEAFDDNGKVHFFGQSLQLLAWEWLPAEQRWKELGVMFDDAINNFPPQRLPNGEWGMMRRNHERKVSMLTGGVKSPLDWAASPVTAYAAAGGFRPEEPDWWTLPDNRLLGLFRDNGRSHRFYRAVSTDNGRTWSPPEQTNFPDATSKFFCLRTSRGYYVLVSNANPARRNPLCLSTSDDGITFTRMARLPIPESTAAGESFQYPHVMERDDHLLIAFSRKKQTVEVIKVSLKEVDRLRKAE